MESTVLYDYSRVEKASDEIIKAYLNGCYKFDAIEFRTAMQDLLKKEFSEHEIFTNISRYDQKDLNPATLTVYKNGKFKLYERVYLDPKKGDPVKVDNFAAVILKMKQDFIYIDDIVNAYRLSDDQTKLLKTFWQDDNLENEVYKFYAV